MKMVWHQAIGICFCNWENIQPVFFQEVFEITLYPEIVLKASGMVENMITGIGLKGLQLSYS